MVFKKLRQSFSKSMNEPEDEYLEIDLDQENEKKNKICQSCKKLPNDKE